VDSDPLQRIAPRHAKLYRLRSRDLASTVDTGIGDAHHARMANQGRLDIHPRRRARAVLVIVGLALALAGCARVPGIYVYENADAAQKGNAKFDAASYVDGIWASQVLPTVKDKAVDAATLLPAIKANPAAAGSQYGRQAGTGSPYAFLIKGTGTVTAVDTKKPSGPVTVAVDTPQGSQDVTLVTGPVIAGTALRDAVGIDFSAFTNQLDYADVGTQLNDRVKREVIAPLNRDTLAGKKITFSGAFAALSPTAVNVIPTAVDVAP
jgi:predicted lipoprotein